MEVLHNLSVSTAVSLALVMVAGPAAYLSLHNVVFVAAVCIRSESHGLYRMRQLSEGAAVRLLSTTKLSFLSQLSYTRVAAHGFAVSDCALYFGRNKAHL